jgi:hypothetical protein
MVVFKGEVIEALAADPVIRQNHGKSGPGVAMILPFAPE